MAMLQFVFLLVLCAVLQVALGRAKYACNNLGIIGGHSIGIRSAPYMAGLYYDDNYFCGATIIHEQFLLTAASCLDDGNVDAVHIGAQHVAEKGTYIDVEQIYCHEDYDTEFYDNDICLIKLSEPIKKFNRKIAKIQLADKNFVIKEGTMVNLTGWGRMNANADGKYPRFLRQTTVPVVPDECCREIDLSMTDKIFCAGSPGRDTCEGDVGGPVTYNNVQIGIISIGYECGTEPGFNTKVSKYIDWINTTIRNNS